jgi:hypothetical protein
MHAVLVAVVKSLASVVRSRTALQFGVLALRHQLALYQQAGRRTQIQPADRLLWAFSRPSTLACGKSYDGSIPRADAYSLAGPNLS